MVMNSHPTYNDGTYGATYTISLDGEVVASGTSDDGDWATSTDDFCLDDGCYEVAVTAGLFGYTSPLYTFDFGDGSFTLGSSGSVTLGDVDCAIGCTDAAADNYDPDATLDDGSCTYPLYLDIALPYTEDGLTTCGFGDDYSSSNTSSSSSYLGGDDASFAFTGTGNSIQVGMTTSDSWTGLFVFDGNPLENGTVVDFSTSSGATTHSIEFESAIGSTYFFVISSWPSTQGVDFDL
jgi:hypothetical protein